MSSPRGPSPTEAQRPGELLPPVVVPAGAPRWVTVELLEQTLRTWQPYYPRRLTVEDALEMILNVGQLHSFWIGGHSREAVRRLGPRQQS